jgi:hypothetical protein
VADEDTTQEEQQDEEQGQNGDGSPEGESDAMEAAKKAKEEEEEAKEKVRQLEDDPPANIEDWPDDKAKYETFGGPEGDEDYEESVTSKLGPSALRHREDGSVEIEGEEVDDPEKYKGDPIPGGPTDPDATRAYGEPDLTDETSADVKGEGSESDDDDSGEDSSESESEGSDDGDSESGDSGDEQGEAS